MTTLRMGTRGSALALAQSGLMARALEALHRGLKVETVVVKTKGDLFGAPAPEQAKLLAQGAKGLWVKEIEEALLERRIDFAVHSGKDLPAELAAGLEIAAFPEREDPRDVLVCAPGLGWASLGKGHKVGTSSLRRRLMLEAAKPGIEVAPLRGNVDTRLRKLREGEFDAMVLALAGLRRLGREDVEHEALEPAAMLPAPAQGALALEVRADRRDVASLVAALDHAETRLCVEIERAFLAEVGGGCGAPVGAYARVRGAGVLFEGFFAREGEARGRRVAGECADPAHRGAFARKMAAEATARA
ncbi:MAG: hydroxymethylbilane synthase [Elusimicrobia bacterium]|nr:hydroxymethylbilane synthase [Elusimicrobiota bacterium]